MNEEKKEKKNMKRKERECRNDVLVCSMCIYAIMEPRV
jgi:hypothetical protein